MTKPISSHSCGNGRYARMVWGSREDCDRCKQADAQFKAAQELYRKRGLITDADPVNVLLQKDDRTSTAITNAATRFACSLLILLYTIGFIYAVTEPDHISGKVSDDAGWVK